MTDFRQYYRALMRHSAGAGVPSADEAWRDFRAAIDRSFAGLYIGR